MVVSERVTVELVDPSPPPPPPPPWPWPLPGHTTEDIKGTLTDIYSLKDKVLSINKEGTPLYYSII